MNISQNTYAELKKKKTSKEGILYDSSSYVKFLENELIHSHSRSMAA
jgi:hypothetical protein